MTGLETSFEFDRPGEHGLGPRTLGEGVMTGAEAREAVVDRIRDGVLAHYDPSEELARMAQAGQVQ